MEPHSPGVPLVLCDDQYQAPVHVSAGGVHYTTTLATLTRCPESKLAKLFNGTLPIPLDPVNHHYFLDMDGHVFTHVLNYLRYGKLLLPHNFDQLPLLLEQAEQLGIKPLFEEIKTICEEEKAKDNSDSSKSGEGVSVGMKKNKLKRCRQKREWEQEKRMDNCVRKMGESFDGLMSKSDDLQGLIVDIVRKMDTVIQKNESKNKEDELKMDNLKKNLVEYIQGELVEKKKTMVDEAENESRNQTEAERVDNLLKSFKECFEHKLCDIESTIEIITKDNADNRQSEDETIQNIIKKVGDSFQELIGNNESNMKMRIKNLESKMEMKVEELDHKGQKENEKIKTLLKSLEESYHRQLENIEKQIELLLVYKI